MAKKKRSILFITPGASKVGGNVFLLDFLRWFKANSDIPFLTVYGHGGELESEFVRLNPAFRFDENFAYRGFFKAKYERLQKLLEVRKRRVQNELNKSDIALIYCNAVTNYDVLKGLRLPSNAPIISHCHELESVIRRTGLASFEKTKELTDHFIAVSRAVKDNLVKNHQVAKDKISMVYGFIPIENFSPEELAQKKRKIFEQLGFPPDAFVVGASGTLYWRKAPDIFLQIARRVYQKNPDVPIYFLWVGGAAKGDFRFYELNHDVEKFGLRQRVRFLEHQPDPIDYFAAFDAFAMTSREDPFPLVCLETAALGKPQICFDEAGGMPEFVENDCGFVVPYLDAESFANKIFALYSDRQLTESFGNNAAQKVRKWHNIEIAAPKILEIIKERGNF